MSLSLVSMYLYMAYTVSRLTKSYFTHIIVEVRDMPKEPFKFWLADKRVHGNTFQRHINLLMLMRDIANCVFLYVLYTKPTVQVTCILVVQLFFTAMGLCFPPYIKNYENVVFNINNICYLMLDVFFIVNIVTKDSMSEKIRYNFLGYSMITAVLILILSNLLIGFYFGTKESCAKRKKKKEKKLLKKQEAQKKALEQSHDPDNSENSISVSSGSDLVKQKDPQNPSFNKVLPFGKISKMSADKLDGSNKNNSEQKHIVKSTIKRRQKEATNFTRDFEQRPLDEKPTASENSLKKYRKPSSKLKSVIRPDIDFENQPSEDRSSLEDNADSLNSTMKTHNLSKVNVGLNEEKEIQSAGLPLKKSAESSKHPGLTSSQFQHKKTHIKPSYKLGKSIAQW